MKPNIQIVTGELFNLITPDPAHVTVRTIAAALSKLCRFTGHCGRFYSVAQHSVLVSRLVHPSLARWGLYHDAAEAFIGDVASPLKMLLPDYKAIEHRVESVVWPALGLYGELPPEVKHADMVAGMTEKRDLMPAGDTGWEDFAHIKPHPEPIVPMHPEMAYAHFMMRARELERVEIAA